MAKSDLIIDIRSMYEKHAWHLKSILLRPQTRDEMRDYIEGLQDEIQLREAAFDGMWFSRASHTKGEAWELRLLAETPYALFQRFNGDELEENRSQALKDMEERMLNYVTKR